MPYHTHSQRATPHPLQNKHPPHDSRKRDTLHPSQATTTPYRTTTPTTPGTPHIPHTPDTHLTITPEHVYINGKPISAMKDTLELSTPSTAEVQTATFTIHPTTVTILNENGEATTLYERPETPAHVWLTPIHNSETRDDEHSSRR